MSALGTDEHHRTLSEYAPGESECPPTDLIKNVFLESGQGLIHMIGCVFKHGWDEALRLCYRKRNVAE